MGQIIHHITPNTSGLAVLMKAVSIGRANPKDQLARPGGRGTVKHVLHTDRHHVGPGCFWPYGGDCRQDPEFALTLGV